MNKVLLLAIILSLAVYLKCSTHMAAAVQMDVSSERASHIAYRPYFTPSEHQPAFGLTYFFGDSYADQTKSELTSITLDRIGFNPIVKNAQRYGIPYMMAVDEELLLDKHSSRPMGVKPHIAVLLPFSSHYELPDGLIDEGNRIGVNFSRQQITGRTGFSVDVVACSIPVPLLHGCLSNHALGLFFDVRKDFLSFITKTDQLLQGNLENLTAPAKPTLLAGQRCQYIETEMSLTELFASNTPVYYRAAEYVSLAIPDQCIPRERKHELEPLFAEYFQDHDHMTSTKKGRTLHILQVPLTEQEAMNAFISKGLGLERL